MPVAVILLVIALVLFVLAALRVAGRFDLIAAGLACVAAALLFGLGLF